MVRVPTIFPLQQKKVVTRRPLTRIKPTTLNGSSMPAAQQETTTGAADDVDPGTACCSTVDDETLPELNPLSDHSYSIHNKSETELLRKISSLKDVIGSLEEEVRKVQAQVISLKRQLDKSRQEQVDSMKLCDRVKQKNRSLKLDLSATYRRMKEAEAKGTTEFRYEAIKQDHKKLRYYTGFTSPERLDVFWSLLEPDAKRLQFWQMKETENEDRRFILPLKTQLILILLRLRLGLDGADLAFRFGVSQSTVSRIWVTWLDFLDNRLRQVPTWLPPHLCDKYRPQAFADKGYNTVDGILDCTEIYIETPSSFRVQSETYSTYKKHNTAKGLIVCSPNGFVTFVSDLAPGRLSDKALTKACGVLDKFTPGRSVMADRGFTISEECKQRSLHLNIPPFMEGRPQLSEEDEQETRHIASVRIHVERVIRRVKNFRILSQIFPNSMSEQLNKVWHVCALLTNFVDEPLL